MDSHLSNAQRCARKADSLVKYGMYDEALGQLDKSIVYLYELKSVTTRYENIQMLNVQIESIDRKKRSIAIKRSESIKKKERVDNLMNRTKAQANSDIRIQHIPIPSSAGALNNTNSINKVDQSPVIIEYCYNNDKKTITNVIKSTDNTECDSMYVHGRKKLDKDEKSIIEELATTNAEYKKVNSYLADEIEQLKRENDLLKVELIKVHMSDSLTSSDSSASSVNTNDQNLNSSTPKQLHNIRSNTNNKYGLNCSDNSMHTVPCFNSSNQHISSGNSSASSSSWSISNSSHKQQKKTQTINEFKSIDLSKYIDNDDDEDESEFVDNYEHYLHHHHTDEESDVSINNPPLEFTIDSI